MVMSVSAAMADEWRPMGNALVVDGWIMPGYVDEHGVQLNPNDYPFEVPVEESVENPGVYRLLNPFCTDSYYLSEFNIDNSTDDYHLVIDARDRTFVLIQPQYCGFTDADSSQPSGRYPYYLSDMGTYMWNLGQQREVINLLKCASVMSGNTIYVTRPTFGTTAGHAIEAWENEYSAIITLPEDTQFDESEWESMGVATVIDGWITPGWKNDDGSVLNPDDYPITCEMLQNIDNPNIYCLVDPYHSQDFVLRSYNLSSTKSYILIDASDEDFVTVEPQFSGFTARNDNDISTYYLTEAGHYMLANNRTAETVKEQGHNSTYSENFISIPTPLFGFSKEGVGKIWNIPHPTYIYMPGYQGVHDVDAITPDTPVEYYNMQGMRIAAPQAGQLYIRRQGSRTDKIVL